MAPGIPLHANETFPAPQALPMMYIHPVNPYPPPQALYSPYSPNKGERFTESHLGDSCVCVLHLPSHPLPNQNPSRPSSVHNVTWMSQGKTQTPSP